MFAPKAELTKAGQPDPHLRPQQWPPGSKPTSVSFLAAANLPCPSLPGALGPAVPVGSLHQLFTRFLHFPSSHRPKNKTLQKGSTAALRCSLFDCRSEVNFA